MRKRLFDFRFFGLVVQERQGASGSQQKKYRMSPHVSIILFLRSRALQIKNAGIVSDKVIMFVSIGWHVLSFFHVKVFNVVYGIC